MRTHPKLIFFMTEDLQRRIYNTVFCTFILMDIDGDRSPMYKVFNSSIISIDSWAQETDAGHIVTLIGDFINIRARAQISMVNRTVLLEVLC